MGLYEISRYEKTFKVKGPYNQSIHNRIKFIEGSWTPGSKGWNVPIKYLNLVENELLPQYGGDNHQNIRIEVKRLKIVNVWRLFHRDLIIVDYTRREYVLNTCVIMSNVTFPTDWKEIDEARMGKTEQKCFSKMLRFFNPIVIKNRKIIILNVSEEQIDALVKQNYSWIGEIEVLPDSVE